MNTFDFIGFQAPLSLKELADNRLESLVKFAPATVKHDAYIVSTPKGYFEGSLKIFTAMGTFRAHAKGRDPRRVLQDLYRRVKGQIVEWGLCHPSLQYFLKHQRRGSGGNGHTPIPMTVSMGG